MTLSAPSVYTVVRISVSMKGKKTNSIDPEHNKHRETDTPLNVPSLTASLSRRTFCPLASRRFYQRLQQEERAITETDVGKIPDLGLTETTE